MSAAEKTLWVVNYHSVDAFLQRAVAVGATAVAIRTDNDLVKAIPLFHAKEIKVFGWRWPSAKSDPAMKEAAKVVQLYEHGLDGYYVDPEGAKAKDGTSMPYDWDQPGLAQLAEDFCGTITDAGHGRPFGTTSHYRAAAVFPKLPWESFFKYSTVLLPQAYWRSSEGTIGHGIPSDNYSQSIAFWRKAGGNEALIVPMAGELAVSNAAEIKSHVDTAQAFGIDRLHFYASEDAATESVWLTVKAA